MPTRGHNKWSKDTHCHLIKVWFQLEGKFYLFLNLKEVAHMYNISNTDQLITLALMLDHAYLTEMEISKYTCKRHNRQQLLALTYLNYQHF